MRVNPDGTVEPIYQQAVAMTQPPYSGKPAWRMTDAAKEAKTAGMYLVNEIFYSLQGEGIMAGTPMAFVRFAECNLRCQVGTAGFDCDTEFSSARAMTPEHLLNTACAESSPQAQWLLFTGGEPGLWLDEKLALLAKERTWKIAVETNGTLPLPVRYIDWICVSPKTAEHTLKIERADELKYVRRRGQALPEPKITAAHYLISPAFQADGSLLYEDLEWCQNLVKENPTWRLSLQSHKLLKIR